MDITLLFRWETWCKTRMGTKTMWSLTSTMRRRKVLVLQIQTHSFRLISDKQVVQLKEKIHENSTHQRQQGQLNWKNSTQGQHHLYTRLMHVLWDTWRRKKVSTKMRQWREIISTYVQPWKLSDRNIRQFDVGATSTSSAIGEEITCT